MSTRAVLSNFGLACGFNLPISSNRSREQAHEELFSSSERTGQLGRMSLSGYHLQLSSWTEAAVVILMNFKVEYTLPKHMESGRGLPRNREERLLWIKRKIEDGYYDSVQIMKAVADTFIEPTEARRAGDKRGTGGPE